MNRLPQLDMIRGLAVLALILMNIYAFAIPPDYAHSLHWQEAAPSLSDTWLFNLQTLLFEGRFITLFSVLFGVSLYLISEKYDVAYLKRRLHWLLLLGIIHGLIWFGDILLWYALTGLFILHRGYLQLAAGQLWRKAAWFFAFGLLVPLFTSVFYLFDPESAALMLADTETVAAEIALWTGPYWPQIADNVQLSFYMAIAFITNFMWHTTALMLLGIALYKTNWFAVGYSTRRTLQLFFGGLLLSASLVWLNHLTNYRLTLNIILPWAFVAQLLMALSFASVIIKYRHQAWLQRWLAPCGRIALTLYLSQTVLMVLLFRVIKPEWFASLDRLQLTAIAMIVIAAQLVFSQIYCRYYQQGPCEWLWRRLSKRPHVQPRFQQDANP